jgi:hypothetical protein
MARHSAQKGVDLLQERDILYEITGRKRVVSTPVVPYSTRSLGEQVEILEV